MRNDGRLEREFETRALERIAQVFGEFRPQFRRVIGTGKTQNQLHMHDAGSRFDLTDAAWFEQADTAYLVMQAGIPELRNSHRLISEFFKAGTPKLEIVLNRYVKSSMGVDEEHIEKALTKPIAWKIPSDYYNVRRMQNEAESLALDDSSIARVLQDMARAACGMPPKPEKRKGFSLFK